MFGFKIMVLPRFEAFDLFDMYGGIGIGLSFAWLNVESDREDIATVYDGEIRTKPGLTFNGLIGSEFPLSDRIAIFGEVSFDMVSFTVKSQKVTTDPDQINYVKDSNTADGPFEIPGSNVGLKIGVNLTIVKGSQSSGGDYSF
jgi:hypothetical protein